MPNCYDDKGFCAKCSKWWLHKQLIWISDKAARCPKCHNMTRLKPRYSHSYYIRKSERAGDVSCWDH